MKNKNTVQNINFLENNLPDKCADLIIADPPYFEVKGSFDFIWNSSEDYLKDVEKWAVECKRILKDNGTLFWWGHAKKIAYSQIILDKYLNLENVIKWKKTDCQTRIGIENFRSFPPVTEHLLMYSQDSVNLTHCVFFIRDYIRSEIEKSKGKIIFKEINEALGTATNGGGVASACLSLSKSEPAMITKEMYLKLQEYCKPFLRREYEELRRPFNNYLKQTDVWEFPQDVHISGKYKHPTQKTERLSRLIIKTCSKKGQTLVVPFAGSGTECAMGIKEGLDVYGFEIEPRYSEMANKRMEKELKTPTLF